MSRASFRATRASVLAARAWILAAFIAGAAFSSTRGASDQANDAAGLVSKVRANVEKFVEQFSYLRYEEDVAQQKLDGHGKVAYKQETVFDSIIRMRYDENKLRVDEQRIAEKNPKRLETRPLLNTYGFSTLAIVFHSYYESSFQFARLDDEAIDGQNLACLHFEHIPGQLTPVLYQMIGADKPLELSGKACVDPASGDVHRIEAALRVASNDLAVREIRAALTYKPVTLQDESTPLWLPATATIDLETPRQHWRNIHHFVDYRKYRVTMNMPGASAQ